MNQEITRYEKNDTALTFDQGILAGLLAQSSIDMYKHDFQAYLEYAGTTERALKASTLSQFRTHLVDTTDMSPNTINRMLAAVRRIMKGAYKEQLITQEQYSLFAEVEGVRVVALKERTKLNARTKITPVQMVALTEAPGTETLVGLRDTALLHTLASSGLRASELASLTVSQIVKQGRGYLLSVRGKNDAEFRDAHLSPRAYDAIQAWLDARPLMHSPFIFTSFEGRGGARLSTKPMSEVAVWQTIVKYAGRVGLEHVKPHDLRRFVGTQLAKGDIRKAQKALGHKNIETTARHYVLDELEVGLTDNLY